jgi:hypothetical protein
MSSRSEESSRREEAAPVRAPGGSSCGSVGAVVVWAGGWCVGRSLGALQASLFLAVWTHVSLTRRAAQCGPRDHTARKRLANICCSYAKVLC